MSEERGKTDHELRGRGTFCEALLDEGIGEHDLGEFDGQIIFI